MKSNLLMWLNRILITLFISCSGINFSFAQSDQLNTVIPPSPRSREFEKFINYKVSLYNGLPEMNINFYTIDLDGVKIPIGISYHASGIKCGQTSGDVGIGWALSSDYRVSRTMHGRLDEAYSMPDMNNFPNGQTINGYLSGFTSAYDRDRYIARYINLRPGGDVPAIAAFQNDYLDGQYDMFTIGLPANSGNFIITDRQNRITTMLDNAALQKVNYTTNDIGINEFDVTDGNGVQYKLGETDANNENFQVYMNGALRKYNSAWLLGKITTPFNDSINFQYLPFTESSEGMPAYSRTMIEGYSGDNLHRADGSSCYPTSYDYGTTQPASVNNYNTKILSGITTPNEQVVVSRNSNGTVAAISITNKNGVLIKKATFFYSQPGSRIFLDSIQVVGNDSVAIEKYSFEYTSKEVDFRNYDCFGYGIYDQGGDYKYATYYGRFDFQRIGKNHYDNMQNPSGNPDYCSGLAIPDYITLNGLDKRNFPTSDAGMLKTITYPTGGTQQFVYEPNQYEAIVNGNPYTISKGGFRIASIYSNDIVKGIALRRNYYYGKGIRVFDPTDPKLYLSEKVVLGLFFGGSNIPNIKSLRKTTQSSGLNEEITAANMQPNNGWYNEVTEDYGEGKIVYKFDIPYANKGFSAYPTNSSYVYFNHEGSPQFPAQYLSSYNCWNKPYLQEKTVYEGKLGVYTARQKENYEYSIPVPSPVSDEFTGFKVAAFALGDDIGVQTLTTSPYDLYTNSGIQSVFNYATYTITRGDVLLKKKITTDYDVLSGSELITTSGYSYTSANLIASEQITNSKGEVFLTNYKYPFNYAGVSASDNISAGVKRMLDINMIYPVIEKSTYKSNTDGTNKRLLSSAFFGYKPTLPLPDKVFKTETAMPVTNFSESSVQGGVVTIDNGYKEQISFDLYDTKGNILQQSKTNNIKEVYIWGYNSRYPVAKIIGSDYNTAKQYIDQTLLDNASNYTDAAVRAELNKLRNNLPNAFVSTYTYSPLIGVTSETDATGKTVYYEYDGFNRLKLVRDKDNNILKLFDYQYQTAVTPLYYNVYKSKNFARNNCGFGNGTTVNYIVNERTYSSLISQSDADKKADDDVNANGQAYANKYGYCTSYYNVTNSKLFTRSNCTGDFMGENVWYTVEAGKYTSDISQADADQKATDDMTLNGPGYANANGQCLAPIYAKMKFENIVPTPTTTTGDVVIKFYSNSDCTIPVTVANILIRVKITKMTTPDNTSVETYEWFNCAGSSQVLKPGFLLSERQSQAPGAPATNYTFTLQSEYGYIVR